MSGVHWAVADTLSSSGRALVDRGWLALEFAQQEETTLTSTTLISIVSEACRRTVERHADFWMLAALSDYSFEEGTRNRSFAGPVASMVRHGASGPVVADLQGGINSVLADELARSDGVRGVVQNPSRSPDIRFDGPEGARAALEVKLLYDLTYTKYYATAAADRPKLLAHRVADPAIELYQVAFTVQLPALDYPAARWNGRPRVSRSRADQIVHSGAERQIEDLTTRLGVPATWPGRRPHVIDLLPIVSVQAASVAKRWYDAEVAPVTSWSFDATRHLTGAGVGIAVWGY